MKINSLTGGALCKSLSGNLWFRTRYFEKRFLSICEACSELGIKIIVIPLVDNGSLDNLSQENDFNYLNDLSQFFEQLDLQIIFESDYK